MIIPIIASLVALGFVVYLSLNVVRQDPGNSRMVEISKAIQEGAKAFLKREYTYIAIFVVIISGLIALAPLFS